MRFITEFEISKDLQYPILFADFRREKQAEELGTRISGVFDWVKDSNDIVDLYKLEIEAFPVDKWIEFKNRFADALPDYDTVSKIRLINALAALEEFHGKPSGDTITNSQL